MKNWKSVLLFLLIVFVTVQYFVLTIEYQDNDFIFAGFIIGFYLLLFLIFGAIALNIELKKYRISKNLRVFKLTTISILIVFVAFGMHMYFVVKDSSNIVLKAEQNFDLNYIKIELREDKTYKFTNGSALGNSYSRGNYIKNDSIITIDTTNSDKLLQSNQLAIRGNQIHMIDSKHRIVDSTFYFIINN
ncbi:hypothetical protein [Chryseobacterium taihuense]|uniref:Uncharacterized protein n=1 Tax=Chryseobacterium taihuense TaxID=1141221 RepID=A0ABY0R294_9FLAO|nr:hypothetical protein [Chryseobacterium taihuense]SDM30587.1 hypothetical protein SAMN05216273_12127 [Chryseobacterium taihuense]